MCMRCVEAPRPMPMTLAADWRPVLQLLGLPHAPRVLAAAPHGSKDLADVIRSVRPRARIVVVDIGAERTGVGERYTVPAERVALEQLRTSLAADSLDLIVFEHAMDDIVLEAVARHEDLGPDEEEPGEYSPRPRALRAYWRSGDLEEVAAPFFVDVLADCRGVLASSGRIVLHHRIVDADLVTGQPMEVYAEYIQLARRWIADSAVELREVPVDSLHPQWWLCLERAE